MSITVWAAPASRLQSRHVLRFLTESRSRIRPEPLRHFATEPPSDSLPSGRGGANRPVAQATRA
jgi:hypothetical protein